MCIRDSYNSYSNSTQTRLVSPVISSTGITSVDVEFYWYHSTDGGATLYLTEGITPQWSTDGTTWTSVGSQIRRYSATAGWTKYVITLPSGAGNQAILYVGFLFQGNAGYNSYLDNVSIKASPICYGPIGLTANNLTVSSVDVSWTPSASGNAPVHYEYAVTTSATHPTSGTITTSTSATGVAITPSVNYYLHVRSECTLGTDYSSWSTSSPFMFIFGDVCSSAISLDALTSPYSGTTVGATNNFSSTCNSTGTAPDLYYSITVPAGFTLTIGQTLSLIHI